MPKESIYLFNSLKETTPYSPTHYRDLTTALVQDKQYEMAFLFFEILLSTQWDEENNDYNLIIATEYIDALGKYVDSSKNRLKRFAKKNK